MKWSKQRQAPAIGQGPPLLPLAAGLVSLTAGGILAGARYVASELTSSPPRGRARAFDFTPWEMGIPYDEVTFPAIDGAALRGWLLPRPESDRYLIALHGYRGKRPELLGISSYLWRHGYNVLLFDFRGHGESDGERVTLGYSETHDFRSALGWLQARQPDAWVGTLGYSMGGAVAILGAAAEPTVRAVVTDCAFASQEEVIRVAWRRRMRVPSSPVVDVAHWLMPLLHGFRFTDVEPLAVVDRIMPRPLLIIHSEADRIVPYDHGRRLFAAAGQPKEFWTIPDEPHCAAYFADRTVYCQRVAAFFDAAYASERGQSGVRKI